MADGIAALGRWLGVGANQLLPMLDGTAPIPVWVFLRAVDFINEAAAAKLSAPQTFDPDRHEGTSSGR
jgi:hypothetical protein